MVTKSLRYTIGKQSFRGRDLDTIPSGEVRLLNDKDYFEMLGLAFSELITTMTTLDDSIKRLQKDIRLLRLGNEVFVYGEKVEESDDVDPEEISE